MLPALSTATEETGPIETDVAATFVGTPPATVVT
jgi:hypothetical protein